MKIRQLKAHLVELTVSLAAISIYTAVFSQLLGSWLN